MKKEKFVREKPIPESKKRAVQDLKKKIENSRTVLIVSCKGLPGKQFHEIKKKLRGKAEIKFAKKNAIIRTIEGIEKGVLKNLKENLKDDFAIIFSDIDPFELSGILVESQSPTKAKGGDISPEDIKIEPGPTNLPAGPAISELQGVGLKVKVADGKLEIVHGNIVAEKDTEITAKVASVLAKLNIMPMKVGFIPVAAYDAKDDAIYTNIVIDKAATLIALKDLIRRALGFAVNVGYVNEKTISYFIAKAAAEEKALERFVKEKKEAGDNDKNIMEEA